MNMQRKEKIRLFSHLPGSRAVLPKTFWVVEAYPSLLLLHGPKGENIEISMQLSEKMEHFTFFQDLQRGDIEISGRLDEHMVCVFFRAEGEDIFLIWKKVPEKGLSVAIRSSFSHISYEKHLVFSGKEMRFSVKAEKYTPSSLEYLALGVHKKMDVESIRKRKNINEILPIWFLLSQWIPPSSAVEPTGPWTLLDICKEKKGKELEKSLLFLWEAGFASLFVPQLVDKNHFGPFEGKEKNSKNLPFSQVKEGAKMIRSFFLRQEGKKLHLLEKLPPSCVSGHFFHVDCEDVGFLDMEFRQRLPRRVFLSSKGNNEICLACPKEIASFRLRCSVQEKGERVKSGVFFSVKKDFLYIFDRFEK